MYGYSTAAFSSEIHTKQEHKLWHKMSLRLIRASIYWLQTDDSVTNCREMCLVLINANHSLHSGIANILFLYATMLCFIISWPTLTLAAPHHTMFDSKTAARNVRRHGSIISDLVIQLETKGEKCSGFGFNYSLCFTATVGERSALTQQWRNVYLLQFRSWVACRNYDTFLSHWLSHSQRHHHIHTMAEQHVPMCWLTVAQKYTTITPKHFLHISPKCGTLGICKHARTFYSFLAT